MVQKSINEKIHMMGDEKFDEMILATIEPPPLPIIIQKEWDQNKPLRHDAWMKNAVRSFRRWLKNLFYHYFGRKYYYWQESTVRKSTRIFFLELCKFGISKEFYNTYEEAFFKLIHNTTQLTFQTKSRK